MKFSIYTCTLLTVAFGVAGPAHAENTAAAKPAESKVAAAPIAAPKGPAANGYQVEMKSYRWRKHPRKNYERLVLEFTRKDKGGGSTPTPNVVPAASGKEATVVVGGVTLTGDSAEAKISDTYGNKSAFLSPISILVDGANGGFSVKLNFKKTDVVAEAMWLDSPSRLVIDVFASANDRNAIRSQAADASDGDEKPEKVAEKAAPATLAAPIALAAAAPKEIKLASAPVALAKAETPTPEKKIMGIPSDAPVATAPATNEPRSLFGTPPPAPAKKVRRKRERQAAAPAPAPMEIPSYPTPAPAHLPHAHAAVEPAHTETPEYLCFPANSQVGLSVFFQPKNRKSDKDREEVKLDIENTQAKASNATNIVCYPSASQVEASISFRDSRSVTDGKDGKDGREPASKSK